MDATNSGLSGDMFLASLLGLSKDPDSILSQLTTLKDFLPHVKKLEIKLRKVTRSGVNVNQLQLLIKESKDQRSAEKLKTALKKFLDQGGLSDAAHEFAQSVLNRLIDAEAAVHNELHEHIHLHELSSVDTLLDILGATMILDEIDAFSPETQIYCSKIPLGGGTVQAAHGELPVPAPATVEILKNSGIVTKGGPVQSELVTPTGAALLVSLKPNYSLGIPELRILRSAYGCGQKTFKTFSNTLRLFLGTAEGSAKEMHPLEKYAQPITILSTNVDDVPGELIGNLISTYPREKILDIQITPSVTKKNRANHQIQVLCKPMHQFTLIKWMIDQLGTLGVRYETVQRICVERKIEVIEFGWKEQTFKVRCKISYLVEGNTEEIVNVKPEFDDLQKISMKTGDPVRKLRMKVMEQISKKFF
ncbi:MAG: nickel pincer cofactor biosynthesis protein LarC [Promethearchaeia archaeon]